MKVWHKMAFSDLDQVDDILDKLGMDYRKTPNPLGGYLIDLTVAEDDPRWPALEALATEKKTFNFHDTIFTNDEILAAEWVRVLPSFEQGFAQPEPGWEKIILEGYCPRCGAGYRQVAPFRLAREPRMGKKQFMGLFGAPELFVVQEVVEALRDSDFRGYEIWDVLIHKTGQPSKVVSQIKIPYVAEPGLAEEDKRTPEKCPTCDITKYGYHLRGYMRLRREALRSDADFQLTNEWFGSGSHVAYREKLVSRRVANMIIDHKWRGVSLKPVELF